MARHFRDLSESETLALAISLEEEDGRVYGDFADGLRDAYPASAAIFDGMQQEGSRHRARLIEMYQQRFGERIPLIRRQDVNLAPATRDAEETAERRRFVLQIVQPGLIGLMDGSVSTLAPLFAAAFATKSSHAALLVGLAASVGAGISMGFAEALSDDGALSGRGRPWIRGGVCGLMTSAGGLGHTLPFLVSHFTMAVTIATVVVGGELAAISYVRHRYMDTPFLAAATQVVIGGGLVLLAGLLIGSA